MTKMLSPSQVAAACAYVSLEFSFALSSWIHASEGNLIAMPIISFLDSTPIYKEARMRMCAAFLFVQGRTYFALAFSAESVPCWSIVDSFILNNASALKINSTEIASKDEVKDPVLA